jgi:soluble lytic murein transglycosylase-like protein
MKRSLIEFIILSAIIITLIVVCSIVMKAPEPKQTERRSEPSGTVTAVDLTTDEPTEAAETAETAVYTCIDIPVETSSKIPETAAQTQPEIIPETTPEIIPYNENKILDVPLDPAIQEYVRTVSNEYGVPFELVMAVMYVESGFDPSAISSHGDYGLMQVSSVNHGWLSAELGITDFLDPYQNVTAGVHILAQKIRESNGEFTTALMKYNRGDAVALEQMANGIFSTDYTDKVLTKYYEYIREG